MEKEQENRLIALAREGDKAAIEEILNGYKNLVRSLARRYILPDGYTEDLIQEGMIGLYYAIMDFDQEKGMSFKNFACLCVKRKIGDGLKKYKAKKNKQPIEFPSPEPPDLDEPLLSDERWNEWVLLMGKILSDFEFRVFMLYIEGGLPVSEICETVAKDGKSVDNAVQRSKKKLQKYLLAREKSK